MAATVCRIESTLGEAEACTGGACPFWEHGGSVLDAACGLDRLDLELGRPDIAAYLLDVRRALEAARTVREREETRRAHSTLWPPELSGR